MPILVDCPHCGMRLDAPDETAGKRVRCPKCKSILPVPEENVPYAQPADVSGDLAEMISIYDPLDERKLARLPVPAIVRAAGIIWLSFGILGFVLLIVGYVVAIWIAGAAPGCPSCCYIFFTWGFFFAGKQTISGRATDTLGNSLGSIGIGSIIVLIGTMMVLAAVANDFGVGGWLIAGSIQLFFGTMLILAGVLGLKGRAAYREWRIEVRS